MTAGVMARVDPGRRDVTFAPEAAVRMRVAVGRGVTPRDRVVHSDCLFLRARREGRDHVGSNAVRAPGLKGLAADRRN